MERFKGANWLGSLALMSQLSSEGCKSYVSQSLVTLREQLNGGNLVISHKCLN
jgi:hypothetical protein